MEYVHGGDIYTHKGMTDFSVNLNPFGPGRAVVEAARKSIDQIGNYPDASCRKLKSALAKRLEVPAEHIICGNGAADLIFTAVLADCPRKALIPVPAFAEYEQALRATGCEICYYKKREATGFQLEEDFLDLLNEDIDMVFLCSPDNPTGKLIDRSMLWKILARCETYGIRMVLDECFIDFAENAATASILADTKRWRTLFILRSLTKMHAIPGIRIGYAVTSDMEFLEKMEQSRQPWSVSIPAQAAGIYAAFFRGKNCHEFSDSGSGSRYHKDCNDPGESETEKTEDSGPGLQQLQRSRRRILSCLYAAERRQPETDRCAGRNSLCRSGRILIWQSRL